LAITPEDWLRPLEGREEERSFLSQDGRKEKKEKDWLSNSQLGDLRVKGGSGGKMRGPVTRKREKRRWEKMDFGPNPEDQ